MSYINSLNVLTDESPLSISEEQLKEELSLWANAQFTFDTEPGSALLDDLDKQQTSEDHHQYLSHHDFPFFADISPQLAVPGSVASPAPYYIPQPSHPGTPVALPRLAPAPSTVMETEPKPSSAALPKKRRESTKPLSSHRLAADEDKRRRNTAASARFRMKKKMREQALEQTAKEMTLKAEALEKRVQELQMEAKWLRALVVEKDPQLLNVADRPSSFTGSN
ncbi:uncharacterized protein BYT42DRAFT_573453 [Radiomyces spectabilis]|uniref:uncharacterized protein n=1 Tax=Radiomyces spectabilis TaxID=64574 RepID=UPI002221293D|nr:uncharacterized protein BYT42DRAFT_573453 [Radiomyces spectabilis]KAI8376112.1 hypothetical protein BYT42DRAFT_573453 [Radiomyces spectabilis]